eukprot:NODE_959_length_2744_cov_0.250662.p2 type:complete len:132 gc:universal NODE_959_length_2744_cov_0.250662:1502-1107(-)
MSIIVMLLYVYAREAINKNFAHLDDAMREQLVEKHIIEKDATKEDEHFAWFSSYDRDMNSKLDGHEVMFGILNEDIVQDEQGEFNDYSKSEYYNDPTYLYEQTENIIDIFDINGDGLISYAEYKEGMGEDY